MTAHAGMLTSTLQTAGAPLSRSLSGTSPNHPCPRCCDALHVYYIAEHHLPAGSCLYLRANQVSPVAVLTFFGCLASFLRLLVKDRTTSCGRHGCGVGNAFSTDVFLRSSYPVAALARLPTSLEYLAISSAVSSSVRSFLSSDLLATTPRGQ
ncbi:hypothetical protein FKP32DRAFT_18987 [Trametes sanguinea]|nr:hypothetical protein FKP32DRAFT_18987 [Trametes sanguinea]